MKDLIIPTRKQLQEGIDAFNEKETRGYIYFLALDQINANWGSPSGMAQGIRVLLDAWHQAFYRFGKYEADLITDCVKNNLKSVDRFKARSIVELSEDEEHGIKDIFNSFLDALKGGKRRSPVAVAKTLHLLAPEYFPLWDTDIAIAYGSWWVFSEFGAMEYIPFCWKMKYIHRKVAKYRCVRQATPKRSVLKLVDEYNYSKYTKKWIAKDVGVRP